jgi:hypothetical protein
MDTTVLFFPRGNDIIVTARFPDISDGTGVTAEFYYKDNRVTADTDPSTMTYSSSVRPDPGNPGATMSVFTIPGTDNDDPGAFWWRVDVIDALLSRRTASCGTLLVEAVLCGSGADLYTRKASSARSGMNVIALYSTGPGIPGR